MNLLKRIYFYIHPTPFIRKCLICGKRVRCGEIESLFHPITDKFLGPDKAIHWQCYVEAVRARKVGELRE